ncbi:MAG TPA: bifunctional DNA-formamidopyrimidine glycosylase/DNA-(apurinic or apyrimidinic site) lyase [Gemmatimonadaceae bacterium]
MAIIASPFFTTVTLVPELPEVERAARTLDAAARGRRIVRARVLHPALARRLPDARLRALVGRRIERVERRGKHQVVVLDDDTALVVHFRMSGDWAIDRGGAELPRFTRAVLDLDDGTRVALVDSRALATLELRARADALPRLGPEPLDDAFSGSVLRAALAGRRVGIKPALLDQRVVAGLGNIYAAEALWLAGVSPRAISGALSTARAERLVSAIREVLSRAPSARYGDDSRDARWRVYGREGEPCARCGARIRRIVQAGRSTYYCPRCQRR